VLTSNPGRTGIVIQLGKEAVDGLYGIGVWNAYALGREPAEVKTWIDGFKAKHSFEPDENAILSYAYTDWFIRGGLMPVGRDVTTDRVAAALAASREKHFIFYGEKGFRDGHISPEDVQVEQVQVRSLDAGQQADVAD
jgi:hypothetical protein